MKALYFQFHSIKDTLEFLLIDKFKNHPVVSQLLNHLQSGKQSQLLK